MTKPSSMTILKLWLTCRPVGLMSRTAGITAFYAATMRRYSAITWARTPGSASYIRRCYDCGGRSGAPEGFTVTQTAEPVERYAFLAVRSCELHAIAVQDRVLLNGPYVDPHYRARREGAFIVAVNCGQAGGTCFCASMNTGPKAREGFDLALTELLGEVHEFLVEVGSDRGAALLATVANRPAEQRQMAQAEGTIARAQGNMGRHMRSDDVRELLQANLEHPRWDDVAQRCLTCGNCTMVCPTCFCTSVWDVNDLSGNAAERKRRWDSCFTMDFSYIHGGSSAARPFALPPVDDT